MGSEMCIRDRSSLLLSELLLEELELLLELEDDEVELRLLVLVLVDVGACGG